MCDLEKTKLAKPIHRRGAEHTEKSQREEKRRKGEEEVFEKTPSFFSLRILCVLCASAVNGALYIEPINDNC
jgi:hypothetical protein